MSEETVGPTRQEVSSHWMALIQGLENREGVHNWAAQWVGKIPVSDPMVDLGLLYLHGFGLHENSDPSRSTGEGGEEYLHSDEDIASSFERWRGECMMYDTDRERYRREKRAAAEAYLEAERRKDNR